VALPAASPTTPRGVPMAPEPEGRTAPGVPAAVRPRARATAGPVPGRPLPRAAACCDWGWESVPGDAASLRPGPACVATAPRPAASARDAVSRLCPAARRWTGTARVSWPDRAWRAASRSAGPREAAPRWAGGRGGPHPGEPDPAVEPRRRARRAAHPARPLRLRHRPAADVRWPRPRGARPGGGALRHPAARGAPQRSGARPGRRRWTGRRRTSRHRPHSASAGPPPVSTSHRRGPTAPCWAARHTPGSARSRRPRDRSTIRAGQPSAGPPRGRWTICAGRYGPVPFGGPARLNVASAR